MAGLFLTSVLDSSIVPLPVPGTTDLFLLWLVSHNGNPWLLASIAIAGSLVGGYSSWSIGKKGGEAALQHWIPSGNSSARPAAISERQSPTSAVSRVI